MMSRKNAENLGLLIGFIVVGIIFLWAFVLQPLGVWVAGDWTWIVVGLGVAGFVGVVYVVKIRLPANEKYKLAVAEASVEWALKKSIVRKRILKERASELEGVGLTDEEKNFQINSWVEEAYRNELSGYGSKTHLVGKQTELEIDRESPLSQKEKEIAINKVGTKCCYPNCSENIALEVHHIIPRADGGTNKENNLVVLCTNHHHLADRGAIPRDRLRMCSVARMKEQDFT
jgi:5-methylcytosine-specific restriction endonuclease McrA